MIQYIIRRLLTLPIVLFLVTTIVFFLMLQLPPEQRVAVYMPSMRPGLSLEEQEAVVQKFIDRYGLNQPFPVQYVNWMRNLLAGQWGYSPSWKQPVLEGLLQRAPASAELGLVAMIPAIILALTLGSQAAYHRGHLPDHAIRAGASVGWAFPPFILGLMLMNVLYAWLGWFPPERLSTWAQQAVEATDFQAYTRLYTIDALLNGNLRLFGDAVRHLVLPGVTLALAQWALLTRIMRSSLLDALTQDYITTARAKGVHEQQIVSLHARRNAVLPVISIGGVAVSLLISGTVVIETIFNYSGIGRAAAEAVMDADVPAVVGFVIFSSLVTTLASLIADVLYAVVDPRVRLY
jgi:peptide/nickel transport system permease protein